MINELKLAEDIFDQLENGKVTTIRKGRRNVALGELIFASVDTNRIQIVNVLSVQYCQLANVYIGDLENDGFKDHHDMWEQMKRFYPDLKFTDEVTIIKFKK